MEHLVKLKNWWIGCPNVWFGSTESDDMEITRKFEHIDSIQYELDILINLYDESIGYIIFQDQISRHISRAKNLPPPYLTNKLDNLIEFVKKFYQLNKTILSGYDFCFVLLPLRHTKKFDLETFVIKETWEKLKALKKNSPDTNTLELINIYRNYLKASYERASCGPTYLATKTESCIDLDKDIIQFTEIYKDILDTNCNQYLLEQELINPNPNNFKDIIESVKRLQQHLIKIKPIVSISGGVDSMVLSYLMKVNNIDFVMTHINYANRGETCEKEKELLEDWANYLGVELYIRDIYEINRPDCMEWDLRNLYECYTQDARFQAYVDTARIKGYEFIPNDSTNGLANGYVVGLAHNHDDCVENILTNICSKSKYNNLYGMELFGTNEFNCWDRAGLNKETCQINFTRPFLKISKKEIYDFAHSYKIPYLYDSTPKWSQRGMIRDLVRPRLIQWNESIIEGLDELVLTLRESLECVDLLVESWISKIKPFDTLDKKDMVYVIKYKMSHSVYTSFNVIKIPESELKPNKIFWSRLFVRLGFKSSSKNLNEVISRIVGLKKKFNSNKINLRDLIIVQINKEHQIYFWKCSDQNIIVGFD